MILLACFRDLKIWPVLVVEISDSLFTGVELHHEPDVLLCPRIRTSVYYELA